MFSRKRNDEREISSTKSQTTLFHAVGNESKRRQRSQCLNHGNWRWIEEKEMNTITESSTVLRPFRESVKESNVSQLASQTILRGIHEICRSQRISNSSPKMNRSWKLRNMTRRDREVVDFTRYRIKNNSKLTNLMKMYRIDQCNLINGK